MKVALKLAGALAIAASAITAPAHAAQIVGSFSLASFGGSYVGGSQTAQTATGLDFGNLFGSSGNGFGTAGTALVGNATGSFFGLNATIANIADISLGALANPVPGTTFISFQGNNALTLSFADASYTRSRLGTSVTITGRATFADGVPEDANDGSFTLAVSSQGGIASAADFTFTANASVPAAVPEPATWAMMMLGMGGIGFAMRRRNTVAYAA